MQIPIIRYPTFYKAWIPNLQAASLVESLFISAVSAILVIRFYLQLTGFPQIGVGGLHIAHMLWGGLLLLFALLLVLTYLNSCTKQLAAIMGGIGLGTFIDELGKFITADNNYFFQPTIALIYAFFVALFLLNRYIATKTQFPDAVYTANALQLLSESLVEDMDHAELAKAKQYLAMCSKPTELSKQIERALRQAESQLKPRNHFSKWFEKQRKRFSSFFQSNKLFYSLLIYSVLSAIITVLLFIPELLVDNLGWIEITQLLLATASSLFVLAGVYKMVHKQWNQAYQLLLYSALISLLFLQFFLFLQNQLLAIADLALSLLMYQVLLTRQKALA